MLRRGRPHWLFVLALGAAAPGVSAQEVTPEADTGAAGPDAPAAAPKAEAAPSAPNAVGTDVALSVPALKPRRAVYTLPECLTMAERNYPKVHEARARAMKMRAQLDEARFAPYSQFTTRGGLALAPGLDGTAVYSPNSDVSINKSLELAWRIGIEGAIPLWTFGKITSLIDAAEFQIKVGEHDVQKEKNEVRLSVRKAFFGAQLARDAYALVREAEQRIDKYLKSLGDKVDEGEADDIDLIRLQMHRAELIARESEAKKQERIALSGLRFLTGARGSFDIPDVPLERVPHSLGPLARYLTAAKLYRPEINMARAGVLARKAQVELEQARYFPNLALGLSGGWSRAPGIADQVNPFVRDEANYLRYGVGLVLEWKMDFLPQAARVAQAEAQLEEVRATERFALGGVGVEVETAYAEAQDAEQRLNAYSDATKFAKRWLIKVQQGIDVGTYEDRDIVDPAKEYALKKFSLMSAIFDYNMALSKLALATGWNTVAATR